MRIYFFVIVIFILVLNLNCHSAGGDSNFEYAKKSIDSLNKSEIMAAKDTIIRNIDSVFEDKIFDTLMSLSKVKKSSQYIDSLNHHKRGITMIVFERPTTDSGYYFVQLGNNGGYRFQPYYSFRIYRNHFLIEYLDPLTDKLLSLKEFKNIK